MNLKEELASIEQQVNALEERRREIYKLSLVAAEEEKVCPNFVAEVLSEKSWSKLAYPIEVSGIAWGEDKFLHRATEPGKIRWVAIRPCSEGSNKTHLGIYLGDLAISASAQYNRASGVLTFSPTFHNPAIFVPDLGRLLFGCESWWRDIESPDDVRQITDADINGVWYVRMMKDLGGEAGKVSE